jgi:hypothetical protein
MMLATSRIKMVGSLIWSAVIVLVFAPWAIARYRRG